MLVLLIVVDAVVIVVPERPERPPDIAIDGAEIGRVRRIEERAAVVLEPTRDVHRDGDIRGRRPDGDRSWESDPDLRMTGRHEGEGVAGPPGGGEGTRHIHRTDLRPDASVGARGNEGVQD